MLDRAPVGIGVLSYHFREDLVRCLDNIISVTKVPNVICVHDNTDDGSNARYVRLNYPNVIVTHTGSNIGCSAARIEMRKKLEEAIPGMEYMMVLDQDMVVKSDWLKDMLDTIESDPKVGMVSWPHFTKQTPDKNGYVSEVGAGATLHRTEMLRETGGWDPRFFMYRFDSWMSLLAKHHGWSTKVVMRYYEGFKNNIERIRETRGIHHVSMHRGIRLYSKWQQAQVHSAILFNELIKKHGLEKINPFNEWPDGWRVKKFGPNRTLFKLGGGDNAVLVLTRPDGKRTYKLVCKQVKKTDIRLLVRRHRTG